jgi:type VI secretion system secreted protein Hcp
MVQIDKIGRCVLAGCLFLLTGAGVAQAAPDFYVAVSGAIQGPFKGELVGKGLEGKFSGSNFEYEVILSHDSLTTQLKQKRQHKPIRIQKAWGPASLQFYSALLKNELLAVTIDFVVPDPATGQPILDHTIKLSGASVASFRSHSAPGQIPAYDLVELVFQKIELIDHKLKAAVADDLVNP